jgi:anti-sigma B factor antagonist
VSEIRKSPAQNDVSLVTSVESGDGSRDGEVVICIGGEIDQANSDDFRAAVEPHIRARATLILDLAGVTFMDSSGLKVLLQTRLEKVADDGAFMLRNPSPAVRLLLAATNLDSLFQLAIDVREPEAITFTPLG